ncbi:MAG: efflux RND transporter periplasmic adaptor subunit, partial [Pseudomonadota bacterium]
PQIDPATRTRIIRAKLDGATALSFGLTGELTIAQRVETPGAWIPMTAVEDGVRGLWTIKTLSDIDDTARVGVEAVEVIYADAERAFVRGTFEDGAAFIPTGVHRVVAGQNVRITQD